MLNNVTQAGVPLEYPNLCEAMTFIANEPNVNENTKMLGIMFGKLEDMIPHNSKFSFLNV